MKEIGVYIHIPFCKSKCSYCDFSSFSGKEQYINEYIECLIEEIKNSSIINCEIDTIYIGGGTPSFIDSKYIKEILKTLKSKFRIYDNAEITIEVNPGTIDKDKLLDYKEAGVNRLSIGLQSTDNKLLKEIGRIHTYEEFINTYNCAREAGFKNINVDLMLGLPNQTLEQLKDSLENVIDLNPEHISIYSLILEEDTPLKIEVDNGKVKLPDEDLERQMYWVTKGILEENNYTHYEISNFAKKGYEAKHNVNCWNQNEYIGFGLASHSYIEGKRFCNISNLDEYIKNVRENKIQNNIITLERQSTEDTKKEYMLLGLRKIEGVDIQKFKNKFSENPIYVFRNELEKLVNEELIEIDLNNIKLTSKGLDLANIVWEKFI